MNEERSGRFSEEEKANIRRWAEEGVRQKEIAHRLHRREESVRWFMRREGLIPEGDRATAPGQTLCIRCMRAATNYEQQCRWSRELKPIDGWNAEEKHMKYNDNYTLRDYVGYKVKDCPQFIADGQEAETIFGRPGRCIICGAETTYTAPIFGKLREKICKALGFYAYFCYKHKPGGREGINLNERALLKLRKEAQRRFEKTDTRENFIGFIGRSFL